MVQFSNLFGAALLVSAALSHPGGSEESTVSLRERQAYRSRARRGLDTCSDHLIADKTLHKAAVKRAQLFRELNTKGFSKRDTEKSLSTDHSVDVDPSVLEDPESIDVSMFESSNQCLLMPEGEIGPFWVKGEHVREDLVDGEPGVPLYLHVQFVDVNTCKPVPDLFMDVWNCNSTGVYGGIQSQMNGVGQDASNLDKTALRGIQKTDEEGMLTFKTLFPGHYGGRTTHVHVVAHLNAEILPNNTLSGGSVPHIGQLFFDQGLITEVEKLKPYNKNTARVTTNANDHVVLYETSDSDFDPFFHYTLLGDSLEDGIFSWVTIGVDTTKDYETSCGAELTEDGGKMCANSGNFGIPSGIFPGGPGFQPGGPGGVPLRPPKK